MIPPSLAGLAMALSSVSVVTSSLLLNNWRPAKDLRSDNDSLLDSSRAGAKKQGNKKDDDDVDEEDGMGLLIQGVMEGCGGGILTTKDGKSGCACPAGQCRCRGCTGCGNESASKETMARA